MLSVSRFDILLDSMSLAKLLKFSESDLSAIYP